MLLPRLMCAALAVTLLYAPTRAEKNHDRDRGATQQPYLHIRLVLVPAVMPPHHKRDDPHRGNAAVIYKLDPTPEDFSIRKESRSMLIENGKQEPVELTTIVLK